MDLQRGGWGVKEGKRRRLGKGDEIGYGSGEAKEGIQGERRRRMKEEKMRIRRRKWDGGKEE